MTYKQLKKQQADRLAREEREKQSRDLLSPVKKYDENTIRFITASKKTKITKNRRYTGLKVEGSKHNGSSKYYKSIEYRGIQVGNYFYMVAALKDKKLMSTYVIRDVYEDIPEWATKESVDFYHNQLKSTST